MTSTWEKDGYLLRPAKTEDAESYFHRNFDPMEGAIAHFTGCKAAFTREEVLSAFSHWLADPDRYTFLLVSPDGEIIGESVLNEIDWEAGCANFRIAIFHQADCSRGLGSWVTEKTLEYAFAALHLHRVELDVFSFNPRAIRAYEKAGFRREGVRREAIPCDGSYADDILMAILEPEWREAHPLFEQSVNGNR